MMALEGLRIIDMTIWQHGPVSTAMLADMGAEVIKIERRESGDPGRYLSIWNFQGFDQDQFPLNYYWENNNRNKKSLAIDLKRPEGVEVMTRLIKRSDAFVSNFREASLERLGLGYESVHKINPRLVYAIGYGVGSKGPDAHRPSADLAAQARAGIMSQIQSAPPMQIWGGLADQTGAFMLCLGITMGLLTRERTGIGQKVEESLFGTQLAVGALMAQGTLFSGTVPSEYRRRALSPFWNVYKTKDDKWLCLSVLEMDRDWRPVCRALDLEWMEEDPRFKSGHDRVHTYSDELIDILDEAFAKKTRDEW
ncbi:MAG: CoA transferase, partial [Dehalococcoidia bacterium]